jgi:hypothetical protein
MERQARESETGSGINPEGPSERAKDPATAGDLELIRQALAVGPEERLAVLQDFVDTFWTPRHG